MRVLVCGSRDWDDYHTLKTTLLDHVGPSRSCTIIEGGARGADRLAAQVAQTWKCGHERYPANWKDHGKAAGPIRNQLMLDEGKPDLVLAFKENFDWSLKRGGTEDMVRRATEAGIPVEVHGCTSPTRLQDGVIPNNGGANRMSTVLDRDKLIVAQNAATAAAAIVAAEIKAGVTPGFDVDRFEAIRGNIVDGTLALGETFLQPQPTPQLAAVPDPVAAVGQAFPGSTNVSGQPQATAPTGAYAQANPDPLPGGAMPRVIKPFAELPDWLPAQFASSKCYPNEELWDNRKDLPQFGGSRSPKAPWFKGKDSGEGVWPPK